MRPGDIDVNPPGVRNLNLRGQLVQVPFRGSHRETQNAPVVPPQEPLWRVLREALTEREESVRHLAKLLNERDPSQSRDSWKRALNRYLDEDAEKPTVPSPETAKLLSELLEKPDDYFVRPQQREIVREQRDRLRDERDRLREEVAELRRLLDAKEAGGSSGSQS